MVTNSSRREPSREQEKSSLLGFPSRARREEMGTGVYKCARPSQASKCSYRTEEKRFSSIHTTVHYHTDNHMEREGINREDGKKGGIIVNLGFPFLVSIKDNVQVRFHHHEHPLNYLFYLSHLNFDLLSSIHKVSGGEPLM